MSLLLLMKTIDVSKVLNLTKDKKFEVTCASFHAVDHIFKVDLPRSLKGHKPAIQAMSLLANGQLQYGYDAHLRDKPIESSEEEASQESSTAEEAAKE